MSCRQDVKTVRENVSATLALYIINAATLRGANPRSATAENIGGYQKMEQNNLLCPLRPINSMGIMDKLQGVVGLKCEKEGCAWWIEDKQKCAIAVIGGKK